MPLTGLGIGKESKCFLIVLVLFHLTPLILAPYPFLSVLGHWTLRPRWNRGLGHSSLSRSSLLPPCAFVQPFTTSVNPTVLSSGPPASWAFSLPSILAFLVCSSPPGYLQVFHNARDSLAAPRKSPPILLHQPLEFQPKSSVESEKGNHRQTVDTPFTILLHCLPSYLPSPHVCDPSLSLKIQVNHAHTHTRTLFQPSQSLWFFSPVIFKSSCCLSTGS